VTTGTLTWLGDLPHAENVDLATLTTMATPGVARLVVTPPDAASLQGLLRRLTEAHVSFILLGGGSNVIFTRNEVRPVVVRLGKGFDFIELTSEEGRLRAGAATLLTQVLNFALRNELAGLEWAVGIPGVVGGAVVGNAGAGKQGIGDHVVRVEGFTRSGEPVDFRPSDIRFDYRNSNLRHLIVTAVEIALRLGKREEILARMAEFRAKRKGQPYGDHSSGCVFRNPPGDHAGRLIDQAGLKGFSVGQASVSPAHANFLVNEGTASPEDVVALIEEVRRRVKESQGVWLELEAILLDPEHIDSPFPSGEGGQGVRR
jgi:UDP-N-acetylmuramate dehydrogenase